MPFRRTLLIAPPLAVVALIGVAPLALVVVWSFWTWDPSTYWIKPDLSLAGYAGILDAGRWTVILSTLVKSFGAALLCSLLPIRCLMPFTSWPDRASRCCSWR